MSTNLFLFYLNCIAVKVYGNQGGDNQNQKLIGDGQNDQPGGSNSN